MKTRGVLDVLRTSLALAYDDHVHRLVEIQRPWLESLRPDKPLPLSSVLERYNKGVAAEIVRYGDHLRDEATSIIEGVVDHIECPSVESVMLIVDEFLQPSLYMTRFALMTDSIDHRMKGYGVAFNIADRRVDHHESLAGCVAENGCRLIRRKIQNSVERLYLKNDVQRSRSFLKTINRTYVQQPALYWIAGTAISVLVALLTL